MARRRLGRRLRLICGEIAGCSLSAYSVVSEFVIWLRYVRRLSIQISSMFRSACDVVSFSQLFPDKRRRTEIHGQSDDKRGDIVAVPPTIPIQSSS